MLGNVKYAAKRETKNTNAAVKAKFSEKKLVIICIYKVLFAAKIVKIFQSTMIYFPIF